MPLPSIVLSAYRVRCPSCARLVGAKLVGVYPDGVVMPRKHQRDGATCAGSFLPDPPARRRRR